MARHLPGGGLFNKTNLGRGGCWEDVGCHLSGAGFLSESHSRGWGRGRSFSLAQATLTPYIQISGLMEVKSEPWSGCLREFTLPGKTNSVKQFCFLLSYSKRGEKKDQ